MTTLNHVLLIKAKTHVFDCQISLRQGENLSPLLFSLYVNDPENYLLSNGGEFILT